MNGDVSGWWGSLALDPPYNSKHPTISDAVYFTFWCNSVKSLIAVPTNISPDPSA